MPELRARALPDTVAHTVRAAVSWHGPGLHTGQSARLTVSPCEAPGWWLEDDAGTRHRLQDATLVDTTRCTAVALPDGARLQTLEHVLAALVGCQIDAAVLRLEGGPEVPALDGSAAPFCASLLEIGRRPLAHPRAVWCVDEVVTVRSPDADGGYVRLSPVAGDAPTVRCRIEFDDLPAEMPQSVTWTASSPQAFARQVAPARTFAFTRWLSSLWNEGLARGGHAGNAVVFDDAGRVVTPGGLRMADEPARHKMLDLIGDLARLGRPLWADIDAVRPGHRLNGHVVAQLAPTST